MLEKPAIPEQLIGARLTAEYGLDVQGVSFLPLGYDVNTAVYRVDTQHGEPFFLKIRQSGFREITVRLPHFLCQQGIRAILPPIATRSGELFGKLGEIVLILYPYKPGRDGYVVRLSDQDWIELGRTFRLIHATRLPQGLSSMLPRENFDPAWRESVRVFLAQAEHTNYGDPVARKVADFLKGKRDEINRLVRRADELASWLRARPPDRVVCHSDAHPGNFLITDEGMLYLVDWDNPILAPKERDLMFFGAGMSADWPGGREEALFYQGYGETAVTHEALVYYRYERIIQDIAEFCKQLLLSDAGGDDREQAYAYLTSSFEPGGVLEAAQESERKHGLRPSP